MGSCFKKPPISVDNNSSCPSPCCDQNSCVESCPCNLYCCVTIRKSGSPENTPPTLPVRLRPSEDQMKNHSIAVGAATNKN